MAMLREATITNSTFQLLQRSKKGSFWMDFLYKIFNEGGGVVLVGLGVTVAPTVFWGSLLFSIGGAMLFRSFSKPLREVSLKKTILTAAFLTVLTAIVVHQYLPEFPISVAMAISGVMAVPLVKRFAARQTEIADAVIDKATGKILK